MGECRSCREPGVLRSRFVFDEFRPRRAEYDSLAHLPLPGGLNRKKIFNGERDLGSEKDRF